MSHLLTSSLVIFVLGEELLDDSAEAPEVRLLKRSLMSVMVSFSLLPFKNAVTTRVSRATFSPNPFSLSLTSIGIPAPSAPMM